MPLGDALVRQRQTQTEQEPTVRTKKCNRKQSEVRARVEHIFRIIKCQFGFRKTRYRGLAKIDSQVNLLVGLANLNLLKRPLMAA
jgi:IS5 family transposase